MTTSIKFSIFVMLALLLFTAGVVSIAQANHSWGKYHWDKSTADTTTNPLELGDNLTTAAWQSSLAGASSDWNQSVLLNTVVPGTSNAECSPSAGQVEVCNDAYGNNNWLGIASIWATRGKSAHITQGIVKLNDTYFNTPNYDTAAWRNLVMCQEVGHTFGLGHQDENFTNANLGTCMDYTSDPDGSVGGQLNNEHPNQHDYDQLASIYAHLNDTSDGGGNPGGGSGKCHPRKGCPSQALETINGSSEWGKAIAQDAQGRNSVFVRNENGYEVITHVLWTMEYEGDGAHSD